MARPLALILAFAAASAGCLNLVRPELPARGPGDPPDPHDAFVPAAERGPARTVENRTGTVSGVSLGPVATDRNIEEFTLERRLSRLVLEMYAEGGDVRLRIVPPECDEDASGTGPCGRVVTTTGGRARTAIEAPDVGAWRVEIEPGRRFTYGTIRDGVWRHHMEFDLSRSVVLPPLPWGHETRPSQRR